MSNESASTPSAEPSAIRKVVCTFLTGAALSIAFFLVFVCVAALSARSHGKDILDSIIYGVQSNLEALFSVTDEGARLRYMMAFVAVMAMTAAPIFITNRKTIPAWIVVALVIQLIITICVGVAISITSKSSIFGSIAFSVLSLFLVDVLTGAFIAKMSSWKVWPFVA
jgi:hypothetical protein